ncbi:MAG: SRPBCC family protein, partial [Solirubrobacteraceae bacterium]
MALVRRSRTLRASTHELWAIVGDPHHLPRWWPRVTRVECVDDDGFTQVLQTTKGRPVRADFRVVRSSAPTLSWWGKELARTPFARALSCSADATRAQPKETA